jgi:hypothetical protein
LINVVKVLDFSYQFSMKLKGSLPQALPTCLILSNGLTMLTGLFNLPVPPLSGRFALAKFLE